MPTPFFFSSTPSSQSYLFLLPIAPQFIPPLRDSEIYLFILQRGISLFISLYFFLSKLKIEISLVLDLLDYGVFHTRSRGENKIK